MKKCRYCENEAVNTLVWLKDKQGRAALIKLPWCGCDLQKALTRFWPSPYLVVEGEDYRVEPLASDEKWVTLAAPEPKGFFRRLREWFCGR